MSTLAVAILIMGLTHCSSSDSDPGVATSTTSAGSGGGAPSGSGGAAPSGSGGGGESGCKDAASCGTTTECHTFTCDGGQCGESFAAENEPCSDGQGCGADKPCVCDGKGACIEATCMDALKNGDETDLDCGANCPGCENGKKCAVNTDCKDGYCDGGVCAPCTTNEQCDDDKWCSSTNGGGGSGGSGGSGGAGGSGGGMSGAMGSCVDDGDVGTACGDDAACKGNANCVDGYCCDSACSNECEACNLNGSEGACSTEENGAACGDTTNTTCNSADTCDGAGLCLDNLQPATTTCGDAGTECTNQDMCDGAGSCKDNGFKTAGTACTPSVLGCNGSGTCTPVAKCQSSNFGVNSGDNWVVCEADNNTAWLSSLGSGKYQANAICVSLGYAGMNAWGGNCGSVCGYCQGGTSCNSTGTRHFSGSGGCTPSTKTTCALGNTVTWECK